MSRRILHGALLLGLGVATACASHPIRPWEYEPRPLADTLPIHEPEERATSLIYDQIDGVVGGIGRALSPTRRTGVPPALNADPFDGVVNSAWFTNRMGTDPITPEELGRGPRTLSGPDQDGEVMVVSIKEEGVTSGFQIEDASGRRWFVKFDPVENWEIASGAEAVATSLLWGAGYHVPENYVFHLDPALLVLDEDIEIDVIENGVPIDYTSTPDEPDEELLTMEIFRRHVLDRYPRRADGTIRALGSLFLEGIPKGPFSYEGMRSDDPNDVIPHQHRRELRGLYVISAWLNHVDTKQGNTLDMFIPAPGSPEDGPAVGYLRHNLIDFGSALGSAATGPHTYRHGTENEFDAGAIGKRFFTLGFYERAWQTVGMDTLSYPPSIGYYSIDNFDPVDWRSNIVNPAFINRTTRDGYWGAKIVMAFPDRHLEAAVATGRYSDASAAGYLLENLKKRRDATGRYWFRQVSPLDAPRIEGDRLVFDDLWIRHFGGTARYRWALDWDAPDPDLEADGAVSSATIELPPPPSGVVAAGDDAYARLEVRKVWDHGEEADRPATIWLTPDGSGWTIVGVRY